MNIALWIVQSLLALTYLFAGGAKLVMSAEQMAAPGPIQLPVLFIRFIGVCEILGGLGLVLPRATGIKSGLTPLAAGGLLIIMAGATVINAINGPVTAAGATAILGLLLAFVIWGRRRT